MNQLRDNTVVPLLDQPAAGLDLADGTSAARVVPSSGGGVWNDGMFTYAPAATNLAYAAGQCIGTVLSSYSGNLVGDGSKVFAKKNGSGRLVSVVVTDKADQKSALTILFFRKDPSGTFTDKVAPTISQINEAVGVVNVAAADYQSVNGCAIAALGGIDQKLDNKDSTAGNEQKLWVLVVSQGTPNYGVSASGALRIKVGME